MIKTGIFDWVECDYCGKWGEPMDAEDVKDLSKKEGWKFTDDVDYCPECWQEVQHRELLALCNEALTLLFMEHEEHCGDPLCKRLQRGRELCVKLDRYTVTEEE
jgi:hypothetical protein